MNPWPPPRVNHISPKTGFQASVLTYEPKSSLRPFPGPQSRRRIHSASSTRRWCFSCCWLFMLTLERISGSQFIGSLQVSLCCVRPEWDHFSFSTAFLCSCVRVSIERRVSPTYTAFSLQLHVNLYMPLHLQGGGRVLFFAQRMFWSFWPLLL